MSAAELASIEARKNIPQLFCMLADHASPVIVFMKTPQPFVAD